MKTRNKIISLCLGVFMSIGVACGASIVEGSLGAKAASTTVATISFGGDITAPWSVTGFSKKSGYHQGAGTLKCYQTTNLFTQTPSTITFSVTVAGGSAKENVNVAVELVDSTGNAISDSAHSINKFASVPSGTTGTTYDFEFSGSSVSSAYGILMTHTKITSWNLRLISASLSYEPAGSVAREVSSVSATIKDGKSYFVGDSISPTDFDVTVTYASGDPLTETITDGTGVSLNKTVLDSTSNSITVSYGGVNATPIFIPATEVAITDIKFAGTIPTIQKLNGEWNLGDLKVLVKYNNKAEYDDVTNDKKLELAFDPEEPNSTSITSVYILAEYPGAPDYVEGDFDVSVQEVTYEGLIEDGTYYIKHVRSGETYYLQRNGDSSKAPNPVTNISDATPLIFEKVADNEYTITASDGKFLYTTDTNNGVRFSDNSYTWVISSGTKSGGVSGTYDFKAKTFDRYLSLYNTQDFRTYVGADSKYRMEDTQVEKVLSTQEKVTNFIDTYMHMGDNVEGQCNEYYAPAKTALLALGEDAIDSFQNDENFNAAKARYEAWATAKGDTKPYEASSSSANGGFNLNSNSGLLTAIILISVTSLTAVGAYIFLRKKKEQ